MASCSHPKFFVSQFAVSSLKLVRAQKRVRVARRMERFGLWRAPDVRESITWMTSEIRTVPFDEHRLPIVQHMNFFDERTGSVAKAVSPFAHKRDVRAVGVDAGRSHRPCGTGIPECGAIDRRKPAHRVPTLISG